MSDDLPAVPADLTPLVGGEMSIGLRIMLDDRLYDRCKQISGIMSKAVGFTPPHLIGQGEACFAVVTRALTWRLDPFAVACATYQTPGGRIGYEGKLVQAILENSGKLEGGVSYEHYGDWSKVTGKFAIRKSEKGKDYAAQTWTRDDAKGLGVIVRAKVKGEEKPREWRFDLEQAFPLNSTLWATDPKTQICYAAGRRFANVAAPGILMGVPFDFDPAEPPPMRDITPPEPARATPTRPSLDDFAREQESRAPRQAPIDVQPQDDTADPADEASSGPQGEAEAEPATFALVIPGSAGKPLVLDNYAAAAKLVLDKARQAPTAAYIRTLVNANGWLAEDDALEIEALADAKDGAQRDLV